MGVTGLWQLLSPTGKPVTLESLEGKILAVDVSIWLNQAVKGMRDRQGNSVANAHLITLFHRVAKLLFYRIKPVFVFDGGVPALKKQTLAARKLKKAEAAVISEKTARKMLQNMLKHHALNAVLTAGPSNELAPVNHPVPVAPTVAGKGTMNDMFALPPLPEVDKPETAYSDGEEDEEDIPGMTQIDENYFKHQNLDTIDVDSPEFLALPAEMRHELLVDIKAARKTKNFSSWEDMPQESTDFSSFQMARLMKRSLIGQKIDDVRKEINSNFSGDIASSFTKGRYAPKVVSQKVASEDSSHYILIKGARNQNEDATKYAEEMDKKPELINVFAASQTSADLEFEQLSRAAGYLKKEEGPTQGVKRPIEEIEEKGHEEEVDDIVSLLREKENRKRELFSSPLKKFKEDEKRRIKEVVLSSEDEDEDEVVKQTEKVIPGNSVDLTFEDEVADAELIKIADDNLEEVDYQAAGGFFVDSDDEKEQKKAKTVRKRKSAEIAIEVEDEVLASVSLDEENCDSVKANLITDLDKKDTCVDSLKETTVEKEEEDKPKLSAQEKRKAILEELKAKKAKLTEAVESDDILSSGDNLETATYTSTVGDLGKDMNTESNQNKNVEEVTLENHKAPENDSSEASDGVVETPVKKTDVKKDILAELKAKLQEERAKLAIQAQENEELSRKVDEEMTANGQNGNKNEKKQMEEMNVKDVDKETGEVKSKQVAIEIEVDLTAAPQPDDDLFPASVFEEKDGQIVGEEEEKPETEEEEDEDEFNLALEKERDAIENPPSPPSPQVMSEVDNEFHGLTQEELADMQAELGKENRKMQKERGKQERIAATITDQMYAEAQDLLQLFGIPYITSPMEAEAQCARLDAAGLTHGSVTDDSDIWLFGGQRVYKNFFNQNKHVEFYTDEAVKNQLLLNRSQLINIALLCGSDYTDGIQGLGPVGAMELMAEFPGKDLDRLQAFKRWWDHAQKHPKMQQESKVKKKLRALFVKEGFPNENVVDAYMNPAVDDSEERFSWSPPDLDLLRDFAYDRLGWVQTKADEILVPMMKQLNVRTNQTSIRSFFGVSFGEPTQMKSKRLQRTINVMKAKELDQCQPEPEVQGQPQGQVKTMSKTMAQIKAQVGGRASKGKGKAGAGAKTKNRSQITKNSGGFVPEVAKVPVRKIIKEVNLSESSSEDSDMELFKAVSQLEDKVTQSATKVVPEAKKGKKVVKKQTTKGKGRGRGRAKGKGQKVKVGKANISESDTD